MYEQWSEALGFEGLYEVSTHGRVRSVDRIDSVGRKRRGAVLNNARIGRKRKGRGSYLRVRLSKGGKVHDVSVHTLVLSSFRGPRPLGMDGCHNDGDVMNNRLDNLRWDTSLANQRDKIRHGTVASGERNGGAKISRMDALEIIGSDAGVGVLARRYGISLTHVRRIRAGESWGCLGAAFKQLGG